MKSQFRHNILLGLMLVTALVSLVPTTVFAAGATAYLTPASGSKSIGETFTLSVDGHLGAFWWGGGPNTDSGTITFPANLLKVTSYDDKTNAAFPYSTTTVDNSAGTITFNQSTAAWTYTNGNSDAHLLSITFQTLTSGTANVAFSAMSYSTGNPTTTGGVYTILAPPAPTPTPTPSPTPTPTKPKASPTPTPTPTPSPTPSPSPTPTPTSESDGDLKITNVTVTASRNENSIAWSLSNPAATQTLSYYSGNDKPTDGGTVTKLDDGSYKLSLQNLKVGTLYHFMIKASTSDGLQGATYSGTLLTRGYPVVLTIQQGGLLIPGAKVVIGERTFVADKDALVATELSDGTITATITPPNSTSTQSVNFVVKKITIPASGDPLAQNFNLDIPAAAVTSHGTTSLLPAIIGGGVVTLTLIGGGVGLLFLRRRQAVLQQVPDVDAGQLAETYGDRVTQPMSNTPEPNLEAEYANPLTDTSPLPEAPVANDQFNEVPAQPAPLPESQPSFDPATLPMPVDTPPPLASDTQPQASPEMTEPSPADSELFGQEINQVEASEQPAVASDEPSAVYDAATGELDIIHHHAAPAEPAPPAQPAPPLPPAPTLAAPLSGPPQGSAI